MPGGVPLELDVARFLAPLVAASAAVLALAAFYWEELQALWARFVERRHVVIRGLGREGLLLAQGLLEQGERVVTIERQATNPAVERCRE